MAFYRRTSIFGNRDIRVYVYKVIENTKNSRLERKKRNNIKDDPSNPLKRILGQKSATHFVPVPILTYNIKREQ